METAQRQNGLINTPESKASYYTRLLGYPPYKESGLDTSY
jgi:hypothetical protein